MRLRDDRFVVATRFRHIKPGDIVEYADNPLWGYEIERIGGPVDPRNANTPIVTLYVKDKSYALQGHPDELIGLIHRPRPQGSTEQSMLRDVALWAASVAHLGEQQPCHPRIHAFMPKLREAMDACELGKPQEGQAPERDPVLRYRIVD